MENDYLHWNLRGDLAEIHASSSSIPLTDAFGAGVSGMRQVYELIKEGGSDLLCLATQVGKCFPRKMLPKRSRRRWDSSLRSE